MKTLWILRHAKAEKSAPSGKDFDRPLAVKGQKGAGLVAGFMQGEKVDLVLCSTAARTRETWDIVSGMVKAEKVVFADQLYLAPVNLLAQLVVQAQVNSLLLVGHNPGMAELALSLAALNPGHPDYSLMRRKYPTAGLAKFDLPQWQAFRQAQLRLFKTPALLEAGMQDED